MTKKSILLFFLIFSHYMGHAQNANPKQIEAAKNAATEYNSLLTAIDPEAALTESQREQIETLHLERITKTAQMRKNGKSAEEIRQANLEIHKENMVNVYKSILNDHQREVRQRSAKTGTENKKAKDTITNSRQNKRQHHPKATSKQIEIAQQDTKTFNAQLVKFSSEAALNQDQEWILDSLNIVRVMHRDELGANGISPKELKAKNLELHQANMEYVFTNVLTDDQLATWTSKGQNKKQVQQTQSAAKSKEKKIVTKQLERAKKDTEQFNKLLTDIDADAALTDKQREQIDALHLERIIAVGEYTQNGASEKEVQNKNREMHKANMAKVYSEILTDKQRAARQAAAKK